ncbi:MAG: carboxylesterase family protein [Planctomycetota bacterium]
MIRSTMGMALVFGVPILLMGILASSAVSQDDKPALSDSDVRKLIKSYFKADEGERKRILESLNSTEPLKRSQVKKWMKTVWAQIRRGPKHDGKSPSTVHHDKYPAKYVLTGRKKGRNLPLCVYLHGGGDEPATNERNWNICKGSAASLGFPLVIVPRNFDDTKIVGWAEDSGILSILAMINEVKRTFSIDTNRVYIGGVSMGGWGTWVLGPVQADCFAGLFSIAGGTGRFELLENLRNTPIAIYIGELDTTYQRVQSQRKARDKLQELQGKDAKGYRFTYNEFPGRGHHISPESERKAGEWLKPCVRDPYPKVVVWRPWKAYKKHFYWLKVDSPRRGMRLEARIVSPTEVDIRTGGVSSFTVFLNDKLVDMEKEIKITVNGAVKFTGKLSRRLPVILETLATREDLNMVFTAAVKIE